MASVSARRSVHTHSRSAATTRSTQTSRSDIPQTHATTRTPPEFSEPRCHSLRLLTNNPAKTDALERHGIEVTTRVPIMTEPTRANAAYLDTKRERMGHGLR